MVLRMAKVVNMANLWLFWSYVIELIYIQTDGQPVIVSIIWNWIDLNYKGG